jgi:tetratricopeptide (TPR) repeat protein
MLRYNRGLALWEIGRHTEAVAEFDRAIAGRPELPMPYADRALAKLCLGDLPGALADCEKSLAADSTYIWARYYRAMARYTAGEFPAATDDFAAVAEKEPAFAAAHLWQHVAARLAGRPPPTGPKPGKGTPWPEPLLAHLRGEMSADNLLAEARRQRVPDDDRRVSAAHTIIGLAHLFAGQSTSAKDSFAAALTVSAPKHFEQMVAHAALNGPGIASAARP